MRIQATPFGSHKFLVYADNVKIRCSKISGGSINFETTEEKEGGNNFSSLILPSRVSYGDITLEQAVIAEDNFLWDWVESRFTLDLSPLPVPSFRRTLRITMPQRLDSKEIILYNALLTSWKISDFDASAGKISLATITFKPQAITFRKKHNG